MTASQTYKKGVSEEEQSVKGQLEKTVMDERFSNDGKYYQATFNPKTGGECTKVQEKNIFE